MTKLLLLAVFALIHPWAQAADSFEQEAAMWRAIKNPKFSLEKTNGDIKFRWPVDSTQEFFGDYEAFAAFQNRNIQGNHNRLLEEAARHRHYLVIHRLLEVTWHKSKVSEVFATVTAARKIAEQALLKTIQSMRKKGVTKSADLSAAMRGLFFLLIFDPELYGLDVNFWNNPKPNFNLDPQVINQLALFVEHYEIVPDEPAALTAHIEDKKAQYPSPQELFKLISEKRYEIRKWATWQGDGEVFKKMLEAGVDLIQLQLQAQIFGYDSTPLVIEQKSLRHKVPPLDLSKITSPLPQNLPTTRSKAGILQAVIQSAHSSLDENGEVKLDIPREFREINQSKTLVSLQKEAILKEGKNPFLESAAEHGQFFFIYRLLEAVWIEDKFGEMTLYLPEVTKKAAQRMSAVLNTMEGKNIEQSVQLLNATKALLLLLVFDPEWNCLNEVSPHFLLAYDIKLQLAFYEMLSTLVTSTTLQRTVSSTYEVLLAGIYQQQDNIKQILENHSRRDQKHFEDMVKAGFQLVRLQLQLELLNQDFDDFKE